MALLRLNVEVVLRELLKGSHTPVICFGVRRVENNGHEILVAIEGWGVPKGDVEVVAMITETQKTVEFRPAINWSAADG